MFKVMIGLKDVSSHKTFVEAYKDFFHGIKQALEGGTSWQMLETTNFITYTFDQFGTTYKGAMDFYTARDFAYDIGLMVGEGQFNENCDFNESDEASQSLIKLAFINSSDTLIAR